MTAVNAGADALGFVFYEKSPRNVTPEIVGEIVTQIPAHIEKVGVFVGNNPNNLLELVHGLRLTGSQVHFGPHVGTVNETTAYGRGCFPPEFKVYLSMPAHWFIESEESARSFIASFAQAAEFMRSQSEEDQRPNFVQAIFLDSGTLPKPGGTGMTFDWHRAAPVVEYMKQTVRVVVAGGLKPTNVAEAIQVLKPWGVDVSSGVESQPGKKDPEKVQAFIAAVRQAERLV